MDRLIRPVWAEIDLDKIEYNMRNIKSLAKDKEVIAVIKADGYGHGAVDIAPVVLESGASRLAVAVLSEAIELRKNSITSPIIILGYTAVDCADDLIKYEIEQTIYDLNYAKELSKKAIELGKKAKVHIAIDTGMGRIGFLPNNKSVEDILEISLLEGIDIVGSFTHFSTADEEDKEYTNKQFSILENFFNKIKSKGINIPLKHAANSAAIMDLPQTHLDGVRAGIVIYGYYPSNEVNKGVLSIKPALTLKTNVVHVKTLEKDLYVSYGRTFKTERETIVATLPIGYADGYSRALSGKGKVIINGKFANIIGRVCMDQCMIDVTDVGEVKVGDEVILLGKEGKLKFNADDIAEIMGTINYEIICMLKQRVPRVYKKNGKVVNVRNYI